jgi:hypothetical protein
MQRTRATQRSHPSGSHGGPLYFLSEDAPLRRLLRRHHRKLWWLHTSYALGLGVFVVLFAQKGFAHARWLMASLGAVWLLMVLFFRFFGTGARAQRFATADTRARATFYVMTYVMKNLYQGMLFFLLPFYWKSATPAAPNMGFVVVLGICAVLSTLDLVFDNFLMRSKVIASVFYSLTLFSCMNLVLPAVVPEVRTIVSIMTAGAVTAIAFILIHLPLAALKNRLTALTLAGAVLAAAGCAWLARTVIPPVPMHMPRATVAARPPIGDKPSVHQGWLRASDFVRLYAETDVVAPGGLGDSLLHVWRRNGQVVSPEETSHVPGPERTARLRSELDKAKVVGNLAGKWSVDVETRDGQLVGRVVFTVQ